MKVKRVARFYRPPAQNIDTASHTDLTNVLNPLGSLTTDGERFTSMIGYAADWANSSGDIKAMVTKPSMSVDSEMMYVDPIKHDTVDGPTQDKRSHNNFGNWTFIRGDEFKYYKTHPRPKKAGF